MLLPVAVRYTEQSSGEERSVCCFLRPHQTEDDSLSFDDLDGMGSRSIPRANIVGILDFETTEPIFVAD